MLILFPILLHEDTFCVHGKYVEEKIKRNPASLSSRSQIIWYDRFALNLEKKARGIHTISIAHAFLSLPLRYAFIPSFFLGAIRVSSFLRRLRRYGIRQ